MDVAILCGGYGTRLAGLWNGPKCLVPLGDGEPLIAHLIRRVRKQLPQATRITLITGHKGDEVVAALRERSLLSPRLIVKRENDPGGTAMALRFAAVKGPVLVLNGDTLPRHNLADLARAWAERRPDVLTTYCGSQSAGAVVLSAFAVGRLFNSVESNLEQWLQQSDFGNTLHVGVNGFLDVGTPYGFELAKIWTEGL